MCGSACGRREESSVIPEPRHPTSDVLAPIGPGQVRLGGYLGRKIDLCISNRIFAQNRERLVEPFRHRGERGCWQTEFWGKWFLSAVAAGRYTGNPDQRQWLRASVREILATQTPDGYIGNYSADSHLKGWDIWGRKYTLLGLLAWYDMAGDAAALDGGRRLAGHLLTEVGPGKADIVRCGLYRGMAATSVLEPVVLLYRRTGDETYLRFAEYIVSRWSSRQGPQLIEKALDGTPVAERFPRPKKWFSWENGEKAYEMMSCYTGLLELYRETGRAAWMNAARRAHENILAAEINIVGSGSAEECWYGGTLRQTQPAHNTMETCVAVSWMEWNAHLLRLTGDPRFADEIEKTAYNALLGAMMPDGSTFAKYSALEGARTLGEAQCGMDLNCCVANGPRGVMLLPQVAVMMGAEGPAVNLYSEGVWNLQLASGTPCRIDVRTDYPLTGRIDLAVRTERPETFRLRLRIPAWSEETSLTVNGSKAGDVHPGAYATIDRHWKPGDRVRLQLDLRGRVLRAADATRQYAAVVRGPLVLARDLRLGQSGIDSVAGGFGDERKLVLLQDVPPPPGITMAFAADAGGIRLCDYASAGNSWEGSSRYRVWMPLA